MNLLRKCLLTKNWLDTLAEEKLTKQGEKMNDTLRGMVERILAEEYEEGCHHIDIWSVSYDIAALFSKQVEEIKTELWKWNSKKCTHENVRSGIYRDSCKKCHDKFFERYEEEK